ncbi:MAG: 4Fe-4S binding protein [Candidatus Brocadiae bacterium]|nr:4Fe-4S binding protein [Candidatus Brocadiia bacterium]
MNDQVDSLSEQQIVYTLSAKCRDCYRCLKVCPVKAIRMKNGQAYVDQSKCIACGTCVRECPQKAKTYISNLYAAMNVVKDSTLSIASVSPSYAAFFPGWQRLRFIAALRRLGFNRIEETSVAAPLVAKQSIQEAMKRESRLSICTACPVSVKYVEKYVPALASALLPVVSPMIAHARWIKSRFGEESSVVFIGPCIAKKAESIRPEYHGVVDAVLTFEEVLKWLENEGIDLKNCEECDLDAQAIGGAAVFPLPGGTFKTAGIECSGFDKAYLAADGADRVMDVLSTRDLGNVLIEPLFCAGGCINGPGIKANTTIFERRRYIAQKPSQLPSSCQKSIYNDSDENFLYCIREAYSDDQRIVIPQYTDEQIKAVLALTGKNSIDDMMNCGACGYQGCREKAIAVLEGMAEPEMCLPHMRRLAEQRTDRIIETSPNGIVVLDKDLKILKMNPAFRQFFAVTDSFIGSDISNIIDPAPFEKLVSGITEKVDITETHQNRGITCHELFYALRQDLQYVGIFVDITASQRDKNKIKKIKEQAASQAREMLERQIRMSQEIAWQLGENSAKTEALVRKLTDLAENGD